jgi:hypothetical protein
MGTLDDLSRFRLDLKAKKPVRSRPPRPRLGERFLKGPIPWPWLTRAAACPGKALAVAVALWFRGGLTGANTVSLSLSGLKEEMGVQRDAARRGLKELEMAGLVLVEHRVGCQPRVTILPCSTATASL